MDEWTEPPTEHPPGTCDWGWCDNEAVAWRWDDESEQWLPVCEEHQE